LLSLCSSPSSCSEERKPLHRTDPANSTSLHTSSSRYICSTYSFALSTSNFV
jgi:hypothetical protein